MHTTHLTYVFVSLIDKTEKKTLDKEIQQQFVVFELKMILKKRNECPIRFHHNFHPIQTVEMLNLKRSENYYQNPTASRLFIYYKRRNSETTPVIAFRHRNSPTFYEH